jgi:hypothetical protein
MVSACAVKSGLSGMMPGPQYNIQVREFFASRA